MISWFFQQDRMEFVLDGSGFATFTSNTHPSAAGGITFNSSRQDYDFKILGAQVSADTIFQTSAQRAALRIRDHLTIGNATFMPWNNGIENWGLTVTGSSLFYSGGTHGANKNAIEVFGDANTRRKINSGRSYKCYYRFTCSW